MVRFTKISQLNFQEVKMSRNERRDSMSGEQMREWQLTERGFADQMSFSQEGYRTIQSYIWALEFYFAKKEIEHIHDVLDKVAAYVAQNPQDVKLFWRFYGTFVSLLKQNAPADKNWNNCLTEEEAGAKDDPKALIPVLHIMADEIMGKVYVRTHAYGNAKSIILEIQQYICAHFSEDISLSALSRQFTISEKYLSSLFKTVVGQNLVSFVNEVRIENAKQILKETTLSVQCIAELCGFNDYFYFSKVFKKKTGVTATQYRAQAQEGSI